jgi:hypothetical protein
MATRKVRVKKLGVKTLLPVLREGQIDPTEYDALTTETQIATGVEQAEENVSWNIILPNTIASRVFSRDMYIWSAKT